MTDAEIIDRVIRKIKSRYRSQCYYYYSARDEEWVSRLINQPDASEIGKLRLFLRAHGVDGFGELLKRLADGQEIDEQTSRGFQVEEPLSPLGKRYQNKYYAVYKFLKDYLSDLPDNDDDAKRMLAWIVKLLDVKKNNLALIGGN